MGSMGKAGPGFSVRMKVMLTNMTMWVLVAGTLGYSALSARQQGWLVTEQQGVLEHQAAVDRATAALGHLRYWYADFAVSRLDDSEKRTIEAQTVLEKLLSDLETSDPEAVNSLRQHVEALTQQMRDAVDAYHVDDRELGNALFLESHTNAEAASRLLLDLVARSQTEADNAAEAVRASSTSMVRNSTAFFVAALLAGLCVSMLLSRSLTAPLGAVVGLAQGLARGDLTVRIELDSRDEFGQMGRAFNEATKSMCESVGAIADNAETLASGSRGLSPLEARRVSCDPPWPSSRYVPESRRPSRSGQPLWVPGSCRCSHGSSAAQP